MSLNERIDGPNAQDGRAAAARARRAAGRRRTGAPLAFYAADGAAALLAAGLSLFVSALLAESFSGATGLAEALAAAGEAAFLAPGAALTWLALSAAAQTAMAALGLYSRDVWELDEGRRALTAGLIVFMVHALPTDPLALLAHGGVALASALTLAFGVTGLRMALRATPTLRRALARPALLVGAGLDADALRQALRESRGLRENAVARLSLSEFLELAGAGDGGGALARRAGAPLERLTVILGPGAAEAELAEQALEAIAALGLEASLALPYRGLARHRLAPRRVFASDLALLDLAAPRNSGAVGRTVKRAFDAAAAGAALIALSPLLLGVVLALKASYGWRASILFSQLRVGKNRARFHCLKFRTMAPDAEARLQALLAADPEARREWDTYQKLSNDPRVTPVGRFLRKTSLDELPQLLNVLRGEMSLVGPRPIVAPELDGYVNDAAYYRSPEFAAYAALRPGVTGLWQVSGRAATAYSERMRLDGWYARNWSLWLDAIIVLKTARAAILGSGAS